MDYRIVCKILVEDLNNPIAITISSEKSVEDLLAALRAKVAPSNIGSVGHSTFHPLEAKTHLSEMRQVELDHNDAESLAFCFELSAYWQTLTELPKNRIHVLVELNDSDMPAVPLSRTWPLLLYFIQFC